MKGGGLECLEKSRLTFITGSDDFSRYIVHKGAKGLEEAAAQSSPGLSMLLNNGSQTSCRKDFMGKRGWCSLKGTGNDRMILILQALEKPCQKTKGMPVEEIRFFTNKRAVDGWCW